MCNLLSDNCPTQNGINQGGALLLSVFNSALEYAITKVQENQVGGGGIASVIFLAAEDSRSG
jgi:hypothetical protein